VGGVFIPIKRLVWVQDLCHSKSIITCCLRKASKQDITFSTSGIGLIAIRAPHFNPTNYFALSRLKHSHGEPAPNCCFGLKKGENWVFVWSIYGRFLSIKTTTMPTMTIAMIMAAVERAKYISVGDCACVGGGDAVGASSPTYA